MANAMKYLEGRDWFRIRVGIITALTSKSVSAVADKRFNLKI